MVYGYVRVSTPVQSPMNQKLQIKQYCEQNKLRKIKWFVEICSGTIEPSKRKLNELFQIAHKGDVIVCTELSRLGRSMMMIMNELDYCLKREIRVIAIKENFTLDDSIGCKALMFAFGLSADVELSCLRERTKAGIERARLKGKRIGRQQGETPHWFKLSPYRLKIKRYMKEGRSINSMAKEFGVTWQTMNNYCKKNINVKPLAPLTSEPKKHGHPTRREIEWFRKHDK